MADPVQRSATYADLEAVPPHLVAEIVFGSLVTHPRPSGLHGAAALSLGDELLGPFQKHRGGPGGWVFIVEPELHLGPHVVVPDLAAWRTERLPHHPPTPYISTAPDWVCELLSPSTENTDRGPKMRIYATYGVAHLWLIDPIDRRLEAYELREGHWLLHETYDGEVAVDAPPFGAVPFQLSALWPLKPAPDAN
jgi:Uma2 family endonuclease